MAVSRMFATRLKKLREISGLNQTQLADNLGVSRGSISYYENCERVPDIEFLDKVSAFFNVSVDFLLGYSENIHKSYTEAGAVTGLSDKAIDILRREYVDTDLLNEIIEDENFVKFLELFGYYCSAYNGFRGIYMKHIYSNDYFTYLLTKLLMEILENIALKKSSDNTVTNKDLDKEQENMVAFDNHIQAIAKQINEEAKIEFEEYLKSHHEELSVQEKIYKHFNNFNMGEKK